MMTFDNLLSAPVLFWVTIAVLAILIFEGLREWDKPWAKPALVVYATVGVWYPLDFLITDANAYQRFEAEILHIAFFQILCCLALLRAFIPSVARWFCVGLRSDYSKVVIEEKWLWFMLRFSVGIWSLLVLLALFRLSYEPNFASIWPAIFWPPLYETKVSMFSHSAMGDSTSFIWAALGYIQKLDCAIFGVVAVLGRGKVRFFAVVMIGLSWPYIFFDRTRNVMLSVLLPGVAAFWIASRVPTIGKLVVSSILILCLDYWFKVVLAYRDDYDMSSFSLTAYSGQSRHHGLDMLRELCFHKRVHFYWPLLAELGEAIFRRGCELYSTRFLGR